MSTNPQTIRRVFIGCSNEAKPIAELISNRLNSLCKKDKIPLKTLSWRDEDANLREPNLESFLNRFIDNVLNKCDFSIFILTPDDILMKRLSKERSVRDNIWLEAGMFLAKKNGLKKTFFFVSGEDKHDMTLPSDIGKDSLATSVRWDCQMVKDYCTVKNNEAKPCPVESFDVNAVEKKIKYEITKYCNKVVDKLKKQIEDELSVKKSDLMIFTGEEDCFKLGMELVNKAKARLFTTISFKQSIPTKLDRETKMQKNMRLALCKKIEKDPPASFVRYMKVKGNPAIKKQYEIFRKLAKKKFGKLLVDNMFVPILFDCLEIIVSNDDVSLAFPDYSEQRLKDSVAFCVYAPNNKPFADTIIQWLKNKLKPCRAISCPDCKSIDCPRRICKPNNKIKICSDCKSNPES